MALAACQPTLAPAPENGTDPPRTESSDPGGASDPDSHPGGGSPPDSTAPPDTTAPPPDTTTPPTDTTSLDGVLIAAGTPVQSTIDAHPPGTRFVLGSGIHLRQTITARSGDEFVGEPGAIMDGDSATEFAIRGEYQAAGVRVRGLEIRNYTPQPQWAALNGVNTVDWVVLDNHVHHNVGGIRIGQRMHVKGNDVHHNGQTGIMGQGDGALIEDNQVSYNNWLHEYDASYEAGGIKITFSDDVVVRGNHVHRNGGIGIWMDLDNRAPYIEDNLVEANERQGIYIEIGYGGVIRRNRTFGNGFQGLWHHRGGIVVTSSPDVEVYDNVVAGNALGIVASQQNRGSGEFGPHILQNLLVRDNDITMSTGFTGVVRLDDVDDEVFRSRNNRFQGNRYALGTEPTYFRWERQYMTDAQWQAAGHDSAGTFQRD